MNAAEGAGKTRILFGEEAISARVETLGSEIAKALGQDILLIAVLKGSFVFTADLMRALHRAGVRPQVDFMQLSSYGTGTESSKVVEMVRDVTDPVEGRNVLVVDDILESGRTMEFARDHLFERGANEVSSVPTILSWATVSTTRITTGNCLSSAFWKKTVRGYPH